MTQRAEMAMSFQCRVCGADCATPRLAFGEYRVVECDGCTLWSTDPPMTDQMRARIYNVGYYGNVDAARFRSRLAEALMRWFRERRARQIASRLGGAQGRRILDVGCGRGYTLAALQRLGADVYGTQLSEPAAKLAASLIGSDRVFVGELADAHYPDAFFDCVTIWHVLEHVVDPLELLRDVARVLKPGGLLYVEVPNAGGLAARLFGCSWLAYDIPHHLYHFTPSTLAATAARAGLQRTTESHFSLEYSPPTLLQTVLNASMGNNNLLFNRLAFSSRSQPSGTAIAIHATAAAVMAFPVLLASVGFAAAGLGDTYGAYFAHAEGDDEQ
jgi:2-polyprenyl-3-methyl-5-hydroxy-6-metoxy-1,4-benzoquinol methylase